MPELKAIVFTSRRESVEAIVRALSQEPFGAPSQGGPAAAPKLRPAAFVGQGASSAKGGGGGLKGMNQKAQREVLQRFRAGDIEGGIAMLAVSLVGGLAMVVLGVRVGRWKAGRRHEGPGC